MPAIAHVSDHVSLDHTLKQGDTWTWVICWISFFFISNMLNFILPSLFLINHLDNVYRFFSFMFWPSKRKHGYGEMKEKIDQPLLLNTYTYVYTSLSLSLKLLCIEIERIAHCSKFQILKELHTAQNFKLTLKRIDLIKNGRTHSNQFPIQLYAVVLAVYKAS